MNGYWKRKPTEFHGHRRGSRMHCRETRKEEKGVYWGSDEAKATSLKYAKKDGISKFQSWIK